MRRDDAFMATACDLAVDGKSSGMIRMMTHRERY
jgi:hypothetical protein